MAVATNIQIALDKTAAVLPEKDQIQQWINTAVYLSGHRKKENQIQITVRIVEEHEITQLNKDYRHKDGATNVLAFPFTPPPGMPEDEDINSLGDLIVCASVVEKEAKEQNKTILAHWSHMIIHGTLHLLGYDHQTDQEALEMESLENRVLAEFGYPDPYK